MRKYRAFKCRIKIFKIVNYQAVISCRSALPLYKLGKNMSNEEVKLFGILITAVITIIGGIVGWFGKMYLDSRIEKLKKVMHLILQTYKDKSVQILNSKKQD